MLSLSDDWKRYWVKRSQDWVIQKTGDPIDHLFFGEETDDPCVILGRLICTHEEIQVGEAFEFCRGEGKGFQYKKNGRTEEVYRQEKDVKLCEMCRSFDVVRQLGE